MFGKPLEQHRWLEQLVGTWGVEQSCQMPSGDSSQSQSVMSCRMIGGLWLVTENKGRSDEGDWTCILSLGYDPRQDAYIGTFIGSMMNHLWQYKGQLDLSGRRLPLVSRGPTFDNQGMANYRDTIEIVSADQWRFDSEMQHEDGQWQQIMTATNTRQE